MATMHEDLFPSDKAASSARARWGEWYGDIWNRLRDWVKYDREPWARVRWQRAGQGAALQWSSCPEADVRAMKAELSAKFGELVHWQVERFTDGTQPETLRVAPEVTHVVEEEDIPETVHQYFSDSGMSSAPDSGWSVGNPAQIRWRVQHPPDD